MTDSPLFLSAQTGDYVLINQSFDLTKENNAMSWWIGQIVCVVGGGREPSVNSLFQIICIDTGVVKTINGGLIEGIVKAKEYKAKIAKH